MSKIEQMNDAVRQSRERHDHINRLRDAELDRLDRAIIQTIHELGATSAWEVYVAMNPRVRFKVFELICRTMFNKPIWS